MNLLLSMAVAVTLFDVPVDTLVLTSGHRIAVAGDVQIAAGRAVFHGADGLLYSLRVEEIDQAATRRLSEARRAPSGSQEETRPFTVSEEERHRLLANLAKSRGVKRAPAPVVEHPSSDVEVSASPAAVDRARADLLEEEWRWRKAARAHREEVTRAEEELQFLRDREQALQDQILGLLNLGFEARDFSYQVWKLESTRESIRRAELELMRAERALEQFERDAREQGILPGWLR